MKDLIRGTIYSKPDKVIEAYKYFKKTPGIKIINIKEKIDDLNNITVNFIFEGKMIGEMQFQYQDQTDEQKERYHANHFIYELIRAKVKIEMLAALNKKAAYMSKHEQLKPLSKL